MRSLDLPPRSSSRRYFPPERAAGTILVLVAALLGACTGVSRAQAPPETVPPTAAPAAAVPRDFTPPGPIPPASPTGWLGRNPYQFSAGDTVEIVARRIRLPGEGQALSRRPYVVYSDFRARRPVPLSVVMRPRTVELTRFSRVIHGADLGAGTASSLGGLGLVSGLWGDKTAGYLIGAGAILGALWGGTAGANEPGLRIRIAPGALPPSRDSRHPLP